MINFEYKYQDNKINMYLERNSYGITNLRFQQEVAQDKYAYMTFSGLAPSSLRGMRDAINGFIKALEAEDDE